MFARVKQQLVARLSALSAEVTCPRCGHVFDRFAGSPAQAFSDLNRPVDCPSCGMTLSPEQIRQAMEGGGQSAGPVMRPPDSKIEKRVVSAQEAVYFIPPSGRTGGMLFFAVVWTVFSLMIFGMFGYQAWSGGGKVPVMSEMLKGVALLGGFSKILPALFPLLIGVVFCSVGVGLLYVALRMRYASHLLYVGPDRVRLERELFGRKTTRDVVTSQIDGVSKAVFYTKNYQPVHGIEIRAGKVKLRFGSSLIVAEKDWLVADIRETVRRAAGS